MGAPVSVVIPVHNGEHYLSEAVESLLAQTMPATEILIVDDGSTDGSASMAEAFDAPVTVIRQRNAGVAAARNTGIVAATQTYIAFLDHDDVAEPRRIESQIAAFERTPAPDIVFGSMSQFLSPELDEETASGLRCDEKVQPSPLPSCFMAPARVFESVGLLDVDSNADFVDWYMRAMERGLEIFFVADLVARRRIHENNQSYRNQANMRRDYIRILKASLDRRRQPGGND